ncbi:MAG: phosphatidylserine decarboxylase [Candidatus Thermoplasmatota archaeon]
MLAKATPLWFFSLFIFLFIFLFISFFYQIFYSLFFLTLILLLFFTIFFRDPEREIGDGIVSPADGKIIELKEENDKLMLCIFMNLHNVHVNRSPIDCEVKKITYYKGKHLPAFFRGAEKNERIETIFETDIGEMKIIQIGGIFARKVISYITEGMKIKKGDRIGMIRFGSRVELILPLGKVKILVKKGEKVIAGATKIGELI